MRIVTWNVASLPPTARNVQLAHGSLAAFFKKELAADIVCLQEVKLSSDKLTKELVCVDGYQSFWATSDERKGYSGVTSWCSDPEWSPEDAEADCLDCNEGRICITYHDGLAVINVYVPNAGDRPSRDRLEYKLEFLSRLRSKMEGLAAQGKQVIAVGDFNVPAAQADLCAGSAPLEEVYDPREVAAINGLMAAFPDAWRLLHPDVDDKFTVWDMKTNARPFNRGSRIDFVLLSRGLLPALRSCEIRYDLPCSWSDHAPVVCDLELEPRAALRRAPCAAWVQLQRRFFDPKQRSIKSMFGGRMAGASQGGGGEAQGGATGSGGGGGRGGRGGRSAGGKATAASGALQSAALQAAAEGRGPGVDCGGDAVAPAQQQIRQESRREDSEDEQEEEEAGPAAKRPRVCLPAVLAVGDPAPMPGRRSPGPGGGGGPDACDGQVPGVHESSIGSRAGGARMDPGPLMGEDQEQRKHGQEQQKKDDEEKKQEQQQQEEQQKQQQQQQQEHPQSRPVARTPSKRAADEARGAGAKGSKPRGGGKGSGARGRGSGGGTGVGGKQISVTAFFAKAASPP